MKFNIIILGLFLTSCTPDNMAEEDVEDTFEEVYKLTKFTKMSIWEDPDTNCQYIVYHGIKSDDIIPRLQKNGRQVCN